MCSLASRYGPWVMSTPPSGIALNGATTGGHLSRHLRLTFTDNPLPYGCGSVRHNIRGSIGSNPAGDDRTTLPWACLCTWINGTVFTLAADDFQTYCLPGAGS